MNVDLAHANADRVVRLMKQTPNFDAFKYAVAGLLEACMDWSSFFPESTKAHLDAEVSRKIRSERISENDVATFYDNLESNRTEEFGDHDSKGFSDIQEQPLRKLHTLYWGHPSFEKLTVDTLTKQGRDRRSLTAVGLRYLFESRGVDIANWFMDLRQPTYRFQLAGAHEGIMQRALADFDPEMKELLSLDIPNEDNSQAYCARLKAKSLQALFDVKIEDEQGSTPSLIQADAQRGAETLATACTTCHGPNRFGPRIPFENIESLTEWLNTSNQREKLSRKIHSPDPNYRMPPTRPLSTQELSDIDLFLEKSKQQ